MVTMALERAGCCFDAALSDEDGSLESFFGAEDGSGGACSGGGLPTFLRAASRTQSSGLKGWFWLLAPSMAALAPAVGGSPSGLPIFSWLTPSSQAFLMSNVRRLSPVCFAQSSREKAHGLPVPPIAAF